VLVCGCVCLFVVNAITLEPVEISSWNFYGSKIWSKVRTTSKMVAFRCIGARVRWFNVSDVLLDIFSFIATNCTNLWELFNDVGNKTEWSCFSGPPYMCSAIFAFCMTRDGNETSVFTTSLFTVSLAQERRALPQTSLPVHRPEPRGVHKYSNLLYLVCSRLSQRLYRPSTVYMISGLSDRTFERHGTICDFPNYRQSACQATCLQSWETSLDPLIVCSDVHLFIHL